MVQLKIHAAQEALSEAVARCKAGLGEARYNEILQSTKPPKATRNAKAAAAGKS